MRKPKPRTWIRGGHVCDVRDVRVLDLAASQRDLYLYRMNSLQHGLQSIRYLGAKLWNALPVDLRNAPSKVSFKQQLKLHLLNTDNE